MTQILELDLNMDIKGRLSPFILTPSKQDLQELMTVLTHNIGHDDGRDGYFMFEYQSGGGVEVVKEVGQK